MFAAFIQPRQILQELRGFGKLALRRRRPRFYRKRGGVFRIYLECLFGLLFRFGMITASQRALRGGDVGIHRLAFLPHRLVQIGQTDLDAQVVRFGQQQLFQQCHGLRLTVVFQVNFRELQKQRPRLAHHSLLYVEVSQPFQRLDLFRSQFGDALVNRDSFGQKAVRHKNLCQPLKILDGLKGFALPNVQLADGHQGDLILRLIFQDVLVFGDRLRNFALVQQLLRGFDVFALVIGHASTRKTVPLAGGSQTAASASETFSLNSGFASKS